ncbi:MAG: prenyltransferase/squalene oxidase repeat-containing protein [Candidatus Sulfotelmatobacter sp.]
MSLANHRVQPAIAHSRTASNSETTTSRVAKALSEAAGLLRGPQRVIPLARILTSDTLRVTFEQRHLYSYTTTNRTTADVVRLLVRWTLDAQRPDGGIAAYYSLLSGYAESYPEVTGYIVPTLYDFAHSTRDDRASQAGERATRWLLSLQMPSGAFPGGLHRDRPQPSVFNTGQILHGLVRAYGETNRSDIKDAAVAAGDWLAQMQQADGSWSGSGTYQGAAHTYYSMVSWALAELSEAVDNDRNDRYGLAAERNLDWVLRHFRPNGWIDGINLRGHPNYLHFIGYVLQGVLECAILRGRSDAIQLASKSAWVLLRKFETAKFLPGAYESDFEGGRRFTCLTGNAQMACVWLRLFELSDDLRYLNAALKMNEMLKRLVPLQGRRGVVGGVSGSYPVWGSYQPLRYISWGCKFLADALLLEQNMKQRYEAACAS